MANIPFRLLESFRPTLPRFTYYSNTSMRRERGEGTFFGCLHIPEHDTLISAKQNTMLANLSLVN
jgi:hypothetical protein